MTDTRVADWYEPLEVVGRGGEATVLKTVDTRHERPVTLQVRVVPHGVSTVPAGQRNERSPATSYNVIDAERGVMVVADEIAAKWASSATWLSHRSNKMTRPGSSGSGANVYSRHPSSPRDVRIIS
jgi:hypothetical protein